MGKILTAALAFALLAGCSWVKKSGPAAPDRQIELPERDGDRSQAFSLPGVPLKFMPPKTRAPGPPPSAGPAAEQPAPAAAPAAQEPAPAAAPAQNQGSEEELQFHLDSAKKYAARKQYKSAAAEYGAALRFLPDKDQRAVHLLERRGAMLLRDGTYPAAAGFFRGAIQRAKELNFSGGDLSNAHLGLAFSLEKQGRLSEAIENYEKVLELSSSNVIKARVAETISGLKAALPAK